MKCLTMIVVLTLWGASALALESTDWDRFHELVAAGAQAYQEQRFEDSVAHLEQARGIVDHPDLLYNIARAHQQLNRCQTAREIYVRYAARNDVTDDDREKVAERLKELTMCVEYGTVQFRCSPESAVVRHSEGQSRECDDIWQLPTGDHEFLVEASDHKAALIVVRITSTEALQRTVRLDTAVTPSESMLPGWTGMAVAITGGALLATGLIVDLTSLSRQEKMSNASDVEELAALRDAARRARVATSVLYISGAAGLLGGAGIILWQSRHDNTSARLELTPTSVQAGFYW